MINQRGSLMRRKILQRTYALLALFVVFFSFLFSTVYRAQAETSVISYDERSIYEDLNDLGLAPELYVQDSGASPQALAFMEYCYSDNGFISQEYYGLYVYMYNPSGKAVKTSGNTVTMATAFEGDKVKSYDSIPLELLDKTENNLLLKFKVQNAYGRFYSLAKAYANGNEAKERRYDVVGVQLTHQESEDTTYATSFYFSGFSAGCGSNVNSPSTLASRSEGFETIKLNVGHTNFRTMAFNDANVCDEINTVYFSVPEDYYENYGGLQKIKAEWWEYKTTPIFVTSDQNAYNALSNYKGVDLSIYENACTSSLPWAVFWEEEIHEISNFAGSIYFYKSYNGRGTGTTSFTDYDLDIDWMKTYHWADADYLPRLDWLFYRNNPDKAEDFSTSRIEVENYMKAYTLAYSSQKKVEDGQGGRFAENLFASSIDADRVEYLDENNDGDNQTATRGKITQEIDAGDDGKLLFEKDKSWWDNLAFWKTDEDFQYTEDYKPIVSLTAEDIAGLNASTFASKYYLNIKDVEGTNGIFAQAQKAIQAGNRFVLFRFANTDYYSSNARFDSVDGETGMSSVDGYVAQETMFLDFDIISLTFRDEGGKETVIGVVSNPIDIINGTDAPPDIVEEDNLLDKIKSWLNDLKDGFDDTTSSIKRVIAIVIGVILVAIVIRIVRDIVGHKRE